MKNIAITILFISTVLTLSAQKTGAEIMQLVDDQTNLRDEYQEMKMTQINDKGKKMERLLKMYVLRNNGMRNSLIVFTSPSDIEGSAFLTVENEDREDDNWLYLPILRKSRRISASDITDKFMGSDFTYEDLKEEDLKDFTYKYLGNETIGSYKTYKIEALPFSASKKAETGYSKRIIYVDQTTSMIVKTEYYNEALQHFKTYEAGNIEKIAGTDKYRTYSVKMTDIVKNHITELSFSTIKVNNDFSNDLFSKRSLESGI